MSQKISFPSVKLTQCVSNLTGVNEHVLFFISIIIIIIIIVFFAYKHDPVVKKLTFLSTHLQLYSFLAHRTLCKLYPTPTGSSGNKQQVYRLDL